MISQFFPKKTNSKMSISRDCVFAIMTGNTSSFSLYQILDERLQNNFESVKRTLKWVRETRQWSPSQFILQCQQLSASRATRAFDREVSYWFLGTTKKHITQNPGDLEDIAKLRYGKVSSMTREEAWEYIHDIANINMSVTIRGSHKAAYGYAIQSELIETACNLLGFTKVDSNEITNNRQDRVYCIKPKRTKKGRCADAIIRLCNRIISVEVTMANRGNSEVVLDHITREVIINDKVADPLLVANILPPRVDRDKAIQLQGFNFLHSLSRYLNINHPILSCRTKSEQDEYLRKAWH